MQELSRMRSAGPFRAPLHVCLACLQQQLTQTKLSTAKFHSDAPSAQVHRAALRVPGSRSTQATWCSLQEALVKSLHACDAIPLLGSCAKMHFPGIAQPASACLQLVASCNCSFRSSSGARDPTALVRMLWQAG